MKIVQYERGGGWSDLGPYDQIRTYLRMVVDVLFFGITTEGIMRPYEPDHNKVFSPIIYSVCLVYMATIPFLGLVQIFYHLKIPMIYSWGVFISEKLSFYPSIVVYYSLPHQGPF